MIDIEHLRFRHSDSASGPASFTLSIDQLHIEAGERLAIIGPSGSGKTTLLHLLAGLYKPQQGRVQIGDQTVSAMTDAQARAFRLSQIGFIFQDFELIDYLNARDNITLPYRLGRSMRLTADVQARANALAESVGLKDRLHHYPAALSQGEKQRLALCRALITNPGLMLADEATGNLDPANKDKIMALLIEQAKARNATLIAVTHDHDLLHWFDRVVNFSDFRTEATV